jgi:hypothetical protein
MQGAATWKTASGSRSSDAVAYSRDALELAKVGKREVLKVRNRSAKRTKTASRNQQLSAKIWPGVHYRTRMYCNVNMGGGPYVCHSPANDKETHLTGF